MKKALVVLLLSVGFAVFPVNILAQQKIMVREARITMAGDLIVETFRGATFSSDPKNVKVVLDTNLDGTYGEFRTWQNPPKDRNGSTGAWLCSEITIYVRTDKIKNAWHLALDNAKRERYGPKDVVPRVD